jgi:hypothetical protein
MRRTKQEILTEERVKEQVFSSSMKNTEDFLDTQEGRSLPLQMRLILMGYSNVRSVDGEWIGTLDYLTTRAILFGLGEIGPRLRYCYQDREEADREISKVTNLDQHPGGNWIKAKGVYRNRKVADDLNPNWSATL